MNAIDRFVPGARVLREAYRLDDALDAMHGQIFLTGTQALVRLLLMQAALDRAHGVASAGFVSGYRGSPLGGVDKQLWRAKARLDAARVSFLPAVNEELAATAVLGTQRVERDPERTAEGVYAMWYGKGPGLDRAGDALRHGHAYGSSPNGGVLVVAGDDHGCVSSSMPHQSDEVMSAWRMPVLHPANVAELIEFGLYGWALSRWSGAWVGLKGISETVESAATVDLDAIVTAFASPDEAPALDAFGAACAPRPPDGLHYRWPDLPSLAIEARLAAKLDAARAFAAVNVIDRLVCPAADADIGIVTCGKAHLDLLEALRRLGLDPGELHRHGVRVYKVGQVFPIEPLRMRAFAQGLREVLVVEEKAPVIEQQMRALLYGRADAPAILGKTDRDARPLLSALGELRPSRVLPVLAEWLARHRPALDRRALVPDFVPPPVPPHGAGAPRRTPYFCSGCPHNTSTRVPEGSHAQAGIGCHFMASWMDRATTGLIQMGGEGVDWVAHSRYTRAPHVFQNLGDGTYFHSGFLAIRQAIAAGANITYKILFNDAVAMTGGQPVDGSISVAAIARQVHAEGAARVVVVSDDPLRYRGHEAEFPAGTAFHPRDELDAVQRGLRDIAGVTVLIYEQTCAAEKRRRRKRDPALRSSTRLVINEAVCEGCGDCGAASNCLSVEPVDTPLGTKRRIDQTSCNQDYSCAKGFCPSFVSVEGAALRKGAGAKLDEARLAAMIAALPMPDPGDWQGPYDLLVTGVGGTGVVTIGALVTMAANLEGKQASQLDFMGFAQKGGAVLCHVRLATHPRWLNQVRIDAQQADAVLACDPVVAASADALAAIRHGRTRVLANAHVMPIAEQVRDPDARTDRESLLEALREAAGASRVEAIDAHAQVLRLLGDTQGTNVFLAGYAWQRALVPVSLAALEQAIRLNGVAVDANLRALHFGRLAAGHPQGLATLLGDADASAGADRAGAVLHAADAARATDPARPIDEVLAAHAAHLRAYQGESLVRRHAALVARVRDAEAAHGDASLPLTRQAAATYARLLAYKDEYEVARLHTDPAFRRALDAQFDGRWTMKFHFAPPWLAQRGADGRPLKRTFDAAWLTPLLRALAAARRLRGTPLDPFGRSLERRMERQLIDDFETMVKRAVPRIADGAARESLLAAFAAPARIRGYGHVKLRHLARAKREEREALRALGLEAPMGEAVRAAIAAHESHEASAGFKGIAIRTVQRPG